MADDEAAASEPASVVPALPPLASSLVGAILKGDPATNAPAGAVRSREGASSAKLTPLSVFVCGFVVLGRAVAGQHQLHYLIGDGFGRHFIQGLQHFHGALGFGLGAVHLELFVPVRDAYFQRRFDTAQVCIRGATQMTQAGVVRRGKNMSENHADNSVSGAAPSRKTALRRPR
jgi:hypothetical protein